MTFKLLIISAILLISTGSLFGYNLYNKSAESPKSNSNNLQENTQNSDLQKLQSDNQKLKEDFSKSESNLNSVKQELQSSNNQVEILLNQIKEKDTQINNLKKGNDKTQDKLSELDKKVKCQELIKKTPEGGLAGYIGVDIEKYYNATKKRLEEVRTSSGNPEDIDAEVKFFESKLAEAKPMYDKYIKECK